MHIFRYLLYLVSVRKLVKGFEPPTYGLQIRCSTVELHQLYIVINAKFDLFY